jgi:arsenate reductase
MFHREGRLLLSNLYICGMKVYGIKNCNTVKKALDWLKDHDIDYEFHDFKKLGVSESELDRWASETGWEALVNRKGTTWRQLEPGQQKSITSKEEAFRLMQAKTSVVKRPVIEKNGRVILGFDEAAYERFFNRS